jgi:hypothetical protein
MIEEQKCDYCGETAVKTVHSFTDKDGTATDHYYCEQHDREYNYAGKDKSMTGV